MDAGTGVQADANTRATITLGWGGSPALTPVHKEGQGQGQGHWESTQFVVRTVNGKEKK